MQLINAEAIEQIVDRAVEATRHLAVIGDDEITKIADALANRMASQPRVMTYAQLADALQVSEATLRRWKNARTIPHIGCGDTVRFDFEAVCEALRPRDGKLDMPAVVPDNPNCD